MSFKSNREDFENALKELSTHLEAIDGVLSTDITDCIESVINEYDGHYSGDIDELVTERNNLQDEINAI